MSIYNTFLSQMSKTAILYLWGCSFIHHMSSLHVNWSPSCTSGTYTWRPRIYVFWTKTPIYVSEIKKFSTDTINLWSGARGGGTSLTIICSALPPNNIFCSCMDRKLLTWKKIFLDIDQMCTVGQSAHVHFNP